MTTNLVVFESTDEVIVGDAAHINKLIKCWFLDGGRNLDDYDTYLFDGCEGASVVSMMKVDADYKGFDVNELMTVELRQELMDAGKLTDELSGR